jgi:hypothetical protein
VPPNGAVVLAENSTGESYVVDVVDAVSVVVPVAGESAWAATGTENQAPVAAAHTQTTDPILRRDLPRTPVDVPPLLPGRKRPTNANPLAPTEIWRWSQRVVDCPHSGATYTFEAISLGFSVGLGGYVDGMASADEAGLTQDRRKPRRQRIRLPTSFYVLMSLSLVFDAIAAVITSNGGPEAESSLCIGVGIGLMVASTVMGHSVARTKRDADDGRL